MFREHISAIGHVGDTKQHYAALMESRINPARRKWRWTPDTPVSTTVTCLLTENNEASTAERGAHAM